MPKKAKPPNPRLFCPECHNETKHTIESTAAWDDDWYGADGKPRTFEVALIFATCDGCSMPALYRWTEDQAPDEADLVFPVLKQFDVSVPEPIRKIWAEAHAIQERAPGAYAVQIGRALEYICQDRGAQGKNLNQQLRDLIKRNELPGSIGQMADKLRVLRNIGAHAGNVEVSVPDAWILGEFFEAIVQYIYVWPAKVEHLKQKVEGRTSASTKAASTKSS